MQLGAARPTRRCSTLRAARARCADGRRRGGRGGLARAAGHAPGRRVRAEPRRRRHRAARACASPAPASRRPSRCSRRSRSASRRSRRSSERVRQDRHRRDRDRPDAAERRRHLHHAEAARRVARSVAKPKDELVRQRCEEALERIPGQQLRVHAADPDALQRADLRRASRRRRQGVRRRLRTCCSRPPERIAAVLRKIPGAAT